MEIQPMKVFKLHSLSSMFSDCKTPQVTLCVCVCVTVNDLNCFDCKHFDKNMYGQLLSNMDLGLSYTAHVFLYIEYIAFEHLKKSELTQCLKYQYIKL